MKKLRMNRFWLRWKCRLYTRNFEASLCCYCWRVSNVSFIRCTEAHVFYLLSRTSVPEFTRQWFKSYRHQTDVSRKFPSTSTILLFYELGKSSNRSCIFGWFSPYIVCWLSIMRHNVAPTSQVRASTIFFLIVKREKVTLCLSLSS
jgi:hypothetical protein